jgi:regulator of extracellular matrix RemA (YlzA/DUF370 family)
MRHKKKARVKVKVKVKANYGRRVRNVIVCGKVHTVPVFPHTGPRPKGIK